MYLNREKERIEYDIRIIQNTEFNNHCSFNGISLFNNMNKEDSRYINLSEKTFYYMKKHLILSLEDDLKCINLELDNFKIEID